MNENLRALSATALRALEDSICVELNALETTLTYPLRGKVNGLIDDLHAVQDEMNERSIQCENDPDTDVCTCELCIIPEFKATYLNGL